MPRDYYACAFRYAGSDEYLLWYSNDCDGVHVDSDGCVPTFCDCDQLRNYAEIHDLAPLTIGDPILHNLDAVDRFISEPLSLPIDCNEVLGVWNLFGDFARSLEPSGASFLDRDQTSDRLYDKVFRGSNLPAITPEGQSYLPTWTTEEIESIQELLKIGFLLFRSSIAPPSKVLEDAEQGGGGNSAALRASP